MPLPFRRESASTWRGHRASRWISAALLALASAASQAGTATVAVAANFAEPMQALAALLEKNTEHQLVISVGATGRLYAQIRNGAPFDVFLAADTRAPAELEAEGLAAPGSRFTYATGQLVLWSAQSDLVDAHGMVLNSNRFRKLAIANPRTAPYGAAAMEVLTRLGLNEAIAPRLVQGESIGQAYNFAATGNAEIAFVALAQVQLNGALKTGSIWTVPSRLYNPIRQDAVLLKRGENNEAARALLALLRSPPGQALIRSFGYAP